MPLANQVGAAGPTHLDRGLTGQESSPDGAGHLAREFEAALRQRRLFLIEQGWMGASDKLVPSPAVEHMRAHWLGTAAKNLAGEGWSGDGVRGLHRRIDLAQGMLALIVGDPSSQLVPWRPALERSAGENVTGVQRGRAISWGLQREGSIDLPPL